MTENNEGWAWVPPQRRAHYYRDARALCGKWALFLTAHVKFEQGNNDSPDNCVACRKRLTLDTEKRTVNR